MELSRAEMVMKLKREIWQLDKKESSHISPISTGLDFLQDAFPGKAFPTGVIHEFLNEDKGATSGFVAGILSALLQRKGVCLWIGPEPTLFPPGLCAFNLLPDSFIFISLQKEKDSLKAIEESLKCNAIAAVVGEINELSFTASRRLQLAVEQSRVTGFLLRKQIHNTSVAVARWKITSIPGETEDGFPGVGHPRWKIELLKARNGKPGVWEVAWINGRFNYRPFHSDTEWIPQKKTG